MKRIHTYGVNIQKLSAVQVPVAEPHFQILEKCIEMLSIGEVILTLVERNAPKY